MTNPDVDAYLANLEPGRRAALDEVRRLVLETVPGVAETIRYRMPTFELEGRVLCAFASQKNYMSLYLDVGLVEEHRSELGRLDIGKSCVRFKKLEDLPLSVVRSILTETAERRGGV